MGIKASALAKLPKPLEKDIQKACLDWLRAHGALAIRINSGAMKGNHKGKRWFMKFNDTPGCSDILCLWPKRFAFTDGGTLILETVGIFLVVEVKRPGEEPTDLQESFLNEVRKRGGIAIVAHSVHELAEALRS